jgi:uncharacterized protein YndB with AHSA1/START domain
MAKIEASVAINRPVEAVFARLTDVGNWSEWNPRLLEVEQTSKGPMGVGTTFRGVSKSERGRWSGPRRSRSTSRTGRWHRE